MFRHSFLTYIKCNGKQYCIGVKLDLHLSRLVNFKEKKVNFQHVQAKKQYLDETERIKRIK